LLPILTTLGTKQTNASDDIKNKNDGGTYGFDCSFTAMFLQIIERHDFATHKFVLEIRARKPFASYKTLIDVASKMTH